MVKALLQEKPILTQLKIGSFFCVTDKKSSWYYYISDIAFWNNCKHIKTILPIRIIIENDIKRIRKTKNLPKLMNGQQFILKHNGTHAIYTIRIHYGSLRDKEVITGVSITKIPNLTNCRCGA